MPPSPPEPPSSATLAEDEGPELPAYAVEALQLMERTANAIAADELDGFVLLLQAEGDTATYVFNTGRQSPDAMLFSLDDYRARLRKFIARTQGTAPANNRSHCEH